MQWCAVGDVDFDHTHQVVTILAVYDTNAWTDASLTPDDVLVNCPLATLFTLYHMWRAGDLRHLAYVHGVGIPSREAASGITERLDEHACQRDCPGVVVVFQTLDRKSVAKGQFTNTSSRVRLKSIHVFVLFTARMVTTW